MPVAKTSREQFLDDVVTTALEGGIGYWSVCSAYEWDGVPARAQIQEFDEDTGEECGPLMEVDRALIRKGIKGILSGEGRISPIIQSYVQDADKNNDAGDVDADVADCIVQFGLFGKLVYG